jgi:hypothetical protein
MVMLFREGITATFNKHNLQAVLEKLCMMYGLPACLPAMRMAAVLHSKSTRS